MALLLSYYLYYSYGKCTKEGGPLVVLNKLTPLYMAEKEKLIERILVLMQNSMAAMQPEVCNGNEMRKSGRDQKFFDFC